MTDSNFPTESGAWLWVSCSPNVFQVGRKARVFFQPYPAGESVGQPDTKHPDYRGFEGTVRAISESGLELLIVNEDRDEWLNVVLGSEHDELIRPDGQEVGFNVNFECPTMKSEWDE